MNILYEHRLVSVTVGACALPARYGAVIKMAARVGERGR